MVKFICFFMVGVMFFSIPAYSGHHNMETFPKVRHSVSDIQQAVAVIFPTDGNNVKGVFYFKQESEGVRVSAVLSGLTPNAEHGVHIHEYGDISGEGALTAGGHYNPANHPHGLPPNKIRHAGSFGNLKADRNGEVSFEFFDATISIAGNYHPIIGRSVIVHANKDDGGQPSGNAGPRIGAGVIGIAK